jgi:hypothetical protein
MDENIETLIEEVEKRPAIYNKTLKEYANINIKKQLWEEVCTAVIPNWNGLYCCYTELERFVLLLYRIGAVCTAVIPNWNGLEGENKTRAGKFTQTLL